MPKEITSFKASLPPVGNALSMDGHGGCKISFAIPESELPKAVKVAMLIGKSFKVVVILNEGKKDEAYL